MNRLWKRLQALRHRRQLDLDLEAEIQFHLDMKAESGGHNEARRQFGNPTGIQEALRDMWSFTWLESWVQDIRYGIRSLAGARGFSIVAILTLALGIGANTAMFTIVDGVLTWNLGLDHLDRIVIIPGENSANHELNFVASYPDFRDYRSRIKSLDGIAAYNMTPANLADSAGLPERLLNVQISANGFRVAEMKPLMGRDFSEADERPEAPAVLVLSHHIWRDRYGQDPNILGKVVRIDEVPRTVIAVMPPDRRFPEDTDLWTPLIPSERRDDRRLMMFGRLPERASLPKVRAELDTVGRALASQYPGTNKDLTVTVRPIAQITGVNKLRPLFLTLLAAVGCVLLIACADVANMMLARGSGRIREMSVRIAIGAGKWRILRQLLVESVLLSIAGGLCGWLVAIVGLRWFDVSTGILQKPVWLHLTMDKTAFLFMGAVSIGAGILFGFAPALRLARTSVEAALRDGGHGAAGGRANLRLSNLLVIFQMVLCIVLLAGAGLMLRSADHLYAVPMGARIENVLTARINLPEAKYKQPEDLVEFHRNARTRLEAIPGAFAEGIASRLPMGGWDSFSAELQDSPTKGVQRIGGIQVSGGYFRVLGIQPLIGRVFGDEEPPLLVINQSFAAKHWPGEIAVGKHLRLIDANKAPGDWMMIGGVIPDVLQDFNDPLAGHPLVYVPYAVSPRRQMSIVTGTRVPPVNLAQDLRIAVQKLDPNLPLFQVRTLQSQVDQNRLERTFFGNICSVFAGIALILATVGLYSVIAHSVSMRMQEIGLRMAMGATRADIQRLVLTQGLKPILIGLLIGIPLAVAAMQAMRALLVGVGPGDPLTFFFVVFTLLLAGLMGCFVPARRATKIDPAIALRCQ